MQAAFIGMNGSMGLVAGRIYEINISSVGDSIIVDWGDRACPYTTLDSLQKNWMLLNNEGKTRPMIYSAGRQCGKTTFLIKKSAETGVTIAVATHQMVKHVMFTAKQMGLKIPQPVTYAEMFRTYHENKTTRYLVDELQMMLSQLNVNIATVTEDYIFQLI